MTELLVRFKFTGFLAAFIARLPALFFLCVLPVVFQWNRTDAAAAAFLIATFCIIILCACSFVRWEMIVLRRSLCKIPICCLICYHHFYFNDWIFVVELCLNHAAHSIPMWQSNTQKKNCKYSIANAHTTTHKINGKHPFGRSKIWNNEIIMFELGEIAQRHGSFSF